MRPWVVWVVLGWVGAGCGSGGSNPVECSNDADCMDRGDAWSCNLATGTCVCEPQCAGRCCGQDGCGGICPDTCAASGTVCNSTTCRCDASCVPKTCGELGKSCGPWNDGCGNVIDCGGCPGDQVCNAAGACVSSCEPTSCAGMGKECGPWNDGCGEIIDCGTCPAGEVCNVAGECVTACSPQSCAQMGKECGNWSDGCGTVIHCGTCPAGQQCDASGLCVGGCVPQSCAQMGKECGSWNDGCGGVVDCGSCPGSQACNASGVCVDDCVPEDCASQGRECGNWSDGCGGVLRCGTCPDGQICDITGNCVGSCSPQSCAQMGKECGSWNDGCGTVIDCGTCPQGRVCSALGQCEDVCVPDCAGACCGPDGCGGTCPDRCADTGQTCNTSTCVCEGDCTPRSCTQMGRECGQWDDGCGGSVDCGSCPADETCDAAGQCTTSSNGQAGDPCPFGEINPDAVECDAGLTCLGIASDPEAHPCSQDGECSMYPDSWNPDCGGGGCGASFCAAPCDASGACPSGFTPVEVGESCYCAPESDPGTGQPGDACPFGEINADSPACESAYACLGIHADPENHPCAAPEECDMYADSWNPDCGGGGCGASFCADICGAGNTCPDGFNPSEVAGTCYCIPSIIPTGSSELGDPCPYDVINETADDCQAGLACLGVPSDPATYPCSDPAECDMFLVTWNPDCGDGGCGASFCSQECDVQTGCPEGYEEQDVSGTCYCVPGPPTGSSGPGEPCPFGDINPGADACQAGLTCLGDTANASSFCTYPCSGDGECQADFPGGCCGDIGSPTLYCLPSRYCR